MPWPEILAGFLAAAVGVGTPLLLAATGEMITERSGVINLGVEGAMLSGALAAAMGSAAGGPWLGVLTGILGGLLISAIFAAVSIGLRADQIITGAAITLFSIGGTGIVFRRAFGEAGPGLGFVSKKSCRLVKIEAIAGYSIGRPTATLRKCSAAKASEKPDSLEVTCASVSLGASAPKRPEKYDDRLFLGGGLGISWVVTVNRVRRHLSTLISRTQS